MMAAAEQDLSGFDLASLIETFNEVAEGLEATHRVLQARVVELQEELADKNRLLVRKERLAALGEMAAGVAHEIRNPLGGIALYASLLERDLVDRPEAASMVVRIRRGVAAMEGIVADMMAFTSDLAPRLERCDLARVVGSSLDTEIAASNGRAVGIRVARDLPRGIGLSADAGLLQRVFQNLVRNALEAMGEEGTLTVRVAREGDGARVEVADTGPGVPTEIRDRVFNPFFTAKERGTGLGLAIVHRIVESHGGTVTVGDAEPHGARFVVTLPVSGPTVDGGGGDGGRNE